MVGHAAEFNRNYVVSDDEFFDSSTLTAREIQNFLTAKSSPLANYVTTDIDGNQKPAAEIIYTAAITYDINPKALLVMLQKEQSLIEGADPAAANYDWALGYGACDSCDMNDPDLAQFKGFAIQMDRAAARMRWFADHQNVLPYFNEKSVDGVLVKAANLATAILYSYTPHIHGNYLFWRVWQRWFVQYYPDGSLLKSLDNNTVYLIRFGEKRPFANMSALLSRYDSGRVVSVSESELDKYELGATIKYLNYSLLKDPKGTINLLVDDVLRPIDSLETFRMLGFNPEDILEAGYEDLSDYEIGETLTMKSVYPLGALMQNKKTGGVYFVQEGVKYPLLAKEIMTLNYPRYRINPVTEDELNQYQTGDPVGFKEGLLIKSTANPTVYLVSAGKLRAISNEKVFTTLGYKWSQIKSVSDKSLKAMQIGEPLSLTYKITP
jgi:hypothetical protein